MRAGAIVSCSAIAAFIGVVATVHAEEVVLQSDGWEVHGVWQPTGDDAPAALLLHDAAGDRDDFEPLVSALNAAGVHALRLELRGHGASTNLGRFQPPYPEHRHINQDAWHDIIAGMRWLRSRPDVTAVAVLAASYSGEQAALALREGNTMADAYVVFSPGNFSDESMTAAESSSVPWLFARTTLESPGSLRWIDEVFAALPTLAPSAEIRVYPGEGHASKMLDGRPDLPNEIASWIEAATRD